MKRHSESLEKTITDILALGPMPKAKLSESVISKTKCTPQGYNKSLRFLKQQEVVTIHGDTVSLSYIWIQNQLMHLAGILHAYQLPAYQSYFGILDEGQTVTYKFRTLRELDSFWAHAILVTADSVYKEGTIVSLNPHDWFELLRPHTNAMWDERLGKVHMQCVVLTHASPEEKKFAFHKNVAHREQMLGVNPLKQAESTYINVLGDLVFEATLDPKAVAWIRQSMSTPGSETLTDMQDEQGSYRLKVKRDAKKALAIKRKVARYFTYLIV